MCSTTVATQFKTRKPQGIVFVPKKGALFLGISDQVITHCLRGTSPGETGFADPEVNLLNTSFICSVGILCTFKGLEGPGKGDLACQSRPRALQPPAKRPCWQPSQAKPSQAGTSQAAAPHRRDTVNGESPDKLIRSLVGGDSGSRTGNKTINHGPDPVVVGILGLFFFPR